MPDVFTKQKRSEVMAKIRARGNQQTELALLAILRHHKITGWRRHKLVKFRTPNRKTREGTPDRSEGRKAQRLKPDSALRTPHSALSPGVRPDFVFPKERVAVFVDGCFWHGCPKHFRLPAGNRAFWRKKHAVNQARDQLVNRRLRAAGWRVLRIWQHELKNEEKVAQRMRKAGCGVG